MDDEKIELVSKAPALKDTEKLSKEEFDINIENKKVACLKGKVAGKYCKSRDARARNTKTILLFLCLPTTKSLPSNQHKLHSTITTLTHREQLHLTRDLHSQLNQTSVRELQQSELDQHHCL